MSVAVMSSLRDVCCHCRSLCWSHTTASPSQLEVNYSLNRHVVLYIFERGTFNFVREFICFKVAKRIIPWDHQKCSY